MIPALLLQMTLFQGYVALASDHLGVRGVFAQELPVTYNHARDLAWIRGCNNWQGYGCGVNVIYIASDVAATAPKDVLQYLAYHEVCHLKLGHNLFPMESLELWHLDVDVCMKNALTTYPWLKLKAAYDLYAFYIRKLRKAQLGAESQQ